MSDSLDLYASLGVSRSATPAEIKAAYKKLARKHHPDVNPGDKRAADRFKEISAAYETLSNPDKRKAYDEFGADALKTGFDPEQARAYRRWSERREAAGRPFERESFDFDLDDLLGGFGGAARRDAGPAAGADLSALVELDLEQAIRGTEVRLELPQERPCDGCSGSGDQPGTARGCSDCGGSGRRQVARGPMRMMSACPTCSGRGRVGTPCERCGGRGAIEERRPITVRIPAGADDGSTMRIAGKGLPGAHGGPPGDLLIETRVRPHPLVQRDGLDLSMKVPITVDEAYSGAQIDIPTFEGPVKLRVPPHSQTGTRLRLRGKGVKRGDKRGDLYAVLDVRLPERHDPEVASALRRAAAAYERPVRQGLAL
jgi:molecular chaperone DnaJ